MHHIITCICFDRNLSTDAKKAWLVSPCRPNLQRLCHPTWQVRWSCNEQVFLNCNRSDRPSPHQCNSHSDRIPPVHIAKADNVYLHPFHNAHCGAQPRRMNCNQQFVACPLRDCSCNFDNRIRKQVVLVLPSAQPSSTTKVLSGNTTFARGSHIHIRVLGLWWRKNIALCTTVWFPPVLNNMHVVKKVRDIYI